MAQLILVKELRMTPTKPNKMAYGAFNIYFQFIFQTCPSTLQFKFYNSKYGQLELREI